jgi:hypothetical protein
LRVGAHQGFLSVGNGLDLETFQAEVELDQLADMRFVFDNQDP